MAALLPGDALTLCGAALLIGLSKGGIGGPLPTMLATLMISHRVSVATAVAKTSVARRTPDCSSTSIAPSVIEL